MLHEFRRTPHFTFRSPSRDYAKILIVNLPSRPAETEDGPLLARGSIFLPQSFRFGFLNAIGKSMTTEELRSADPSLLSAPLRALQEDAAGRWDTAHREVQDDDSKAAAWVHAYLHRKEGDFGNAGYWYSRAGKPEYQGALEDEWEEIARALLSP